MLKIVIYLTSTLSVTVETVYLIIYWKKARIVRIGVWYKETSQQGSISRYWWRVKARKVEDARITHSLYRRPNCSIPLFFCFLKYFYKQSVCDTVQYSTVRCLTVLYLSSSVFLNIFTNSLFMTQYSTVQYEA